ncbi:N-acyl homoserine lactonase family protein [Nocardia bhagyanarayanae]|uniref:Glyoxylase-like metal-dependent hydrolase (Beta-lactamase superfamily II) n=1 Tax=Nocardia bhagyanarayanae TaxID=1215925 RepID=A0A543FFB1_9NOCA|nr:N-acyl homoserine lactonase family protein [Nocardia bhagyanarayanae]TQM32558.1 glyoxylase-like metal-dependent hydrolase (beta-lactamase superfamily II) [Nocardia bhagyanarayanae]
MAATKTIRRVWALDAPQLTVDCGILMLGSGGVQETIPAPTFLIEHDEGLMVFDAGLATTGAGDPAAAYGELASAFHIDFPEAYRLDRQIESIGYATRDVRRVVLSHMHFDHTGGLDLFPHAQGFIGAGELRYAKTPSNLDAAFFREDDITAAQKIAWIEVPARYDHDLFGDGSVTLLSLHGHTPGTLGLKLRMPDESTLVLTSDAAHKWDNVDLTIGMPFDVDRTNKNSSLQKIKLLSTQPGTTVWISHDPTDWAELRAGGSEITSAATLRARTADSVPA